VIQRLVLKLAVAAAILGSFAAWALFMPYKSFGENTFVELPHGTGTQAMANALESAGVIRSSWAFMLQRALRRSARLQAGEYRFTDAASVYQVFDRISRGDVYTFEFTVPEGSNMFDIGRLLEEKGIAPAADFLEVATKPTLIHDLAPNAQSLEGFLFPSTYRLTHNSTAAQVAKMMTDEFRKEWAKVKAGQSAATLDLQKAVTLASLVEKETGVAEERPLVASVFTNRLAKGMRLECDPTTIYAALLEDRYRGKIHKSDLASTNPYNTYQNSGLPPGPIANPGADALKAALAPAETKFLYFVAKPAGGGHQFSATLADHAKAVQVYRNAAQHKAL
jgi:UPF0755 protein